ncbi:MAG: MoaD family protein [Dethiobacter sp.]|jgi:molybdopterin synthase sulfur carrier subunit|nr:MoaD family protein [Dethiobacter sp.]
MKVEMFSYIRQVAASECVIEIETRDVKSLLHYLSALYGDSFRKMIFNEDGSLNNLINILINGQNIILLNGLNTELKIDDLVSLIPFVSGG